MKVSFLVFVLLMIPGFPGAGSEPQGCEVDDDEEYAVFAAVLFPNEPDIPEGMTDASQRDAYIANKRVYLDGFHGSSYRIQDMSMSSGMNEESDLARDFNRRNGKTCRFQEKELRKYLTPNQIVRFFSPAAVGKYSTVLSPIPAVGNEIENEGFMDSEVVRLSRPGFNESRIRAVVDVDLQAGPEMGVGYRVYLDKSPKSGKWIIESADRIRIY